MLKQFQIGPDRAIAKFDVFDQVDVTGKEDLKQVIGQDHLVGRVLDPQSQRVAAAVAQEIEIRPAQIVLEFQQVVLGAKNNGGEIPVADDVLTIAAPENIGVKARPPGEEVVARPTVQRVVVQKSINRVVAIGAGIGDHLVDDLLKRQHRAGFENDFLDLVRGDEIEPRIGPHQPAENAQIETNPVHLPFDQDGIARFIALGVKDGNQQVRAFAIACQTDGVARDIAPEHQEIDARLDGAEREIAQIVDDIVTIPELEDIGIPACAAA